MTVLKNDAVSAAVSSHVTLREVCITVCDSPARYATVTGRGGRLFVPQLGYIAACCPTSTWKI